MIVDAHQHFWKVDRGDYAWMTPTISDLFRDYLPPDLEPLLRASGVDKTILVQAAQTEAETDFLLSIAEETDFVGGVVGWLELDDDRFPNRLDAYRKKPKFVGVRPMLQDIADDAYILRPRVIASLEYLAEQSFPFEFLTFPRHLANVVTVLGRVPGLHAVIDHLSKPPISTGVLDPWRMLMSQVAAFPNVYCKVSGMMTEADHRNWRISDLRPYVDHVIDVFGPKRVMFGSDWPVSVQAAGYGQVYKETRSLMQNRLSSASVAAAFGGNAIRFYGL